MYLYRPVDSQGNTLKFWLSATRDVQVVKRFFTKAFDACHIVTPRVMTVDKNAAYPKALHELKAVGAVPASCELRQSKYLNNLIEQDHRAHQPAIPSQISCNTTVLAWVITGGWVLSLCISKTHQTLYDLLAGARVVKSSSD